MPSELPKVRPASLRRALGRIGVQRGINEALEYHENNNPELMSWVDNYVNSIGDPAAQVRIYRAVATLMEALNYEAGELPAVSAGNIASTEREMARMDGRHRYNDWSENALLEKWYLKTRQNLPDDKSRAHLTHVLDGVMLMLQRQYELWALPPLNPETRDS